MSVMEEKIDYCPFCGRKDSLYRDADVWQCEGCKRKFILIIPSDKLPGLHIMNLQPSAAKYDGGSLPIRNFTLSNPMGKKARLYFVKRSIRGKGSNKK